jgi:hypothetical protein
MIKDTNAEYERTVLSDDQMASVLANSNWAKMERDSRSLPVVPSRKCTKKAAEDEEE